jgi:hypothetical protein
MYKLLYRQIESSLGNWGLGAPRGPQGAPRGWAEIPSPAWPASAWALLLPVWRRRYGFCRIPDGDSGWILSDIESGIERDIE